MIKTKIQLLKILSGVLVLMFTLPVGTKAQIGKDFVDIADNYRKFAEFEKALEYCEKGISAIKKEIDERMADPSILSKAYYLKANILLSKNASNDEIIIELLNALLADPNYHPPGEYVNHPIIIQLIGKAKEKYNIELKKTFEKAVGLFSDGKFCLAEEILKPVASKCKNPKLAIKILRTCEEKCRNIKIVKLIASAKIALEAKDYERAKSLFNEVLSLDPENGIAVESLKKIKVLDVYAKKEKKKQKKIKKFKALKKVLVFPIIFEGNYKNGNINIIKKLITQEKVYNALASIDNIEIACISPEKANFYKTEFKFKGYSEFIVRKNMPYGINDSLFIFKFILEGFEDDGVYSIGSLPKSKMLVLNGIFKKENQHFFVFVRVKNFIDENNLLEIELDLNIYSWQDPKKPVLAKYWHGMSKPVKLKSKLREMKLLFRKYFIKKEV